MNAYYVYTYSEPGSHEPFYCGKGKGNRSHQHLKLCYIKQNTHFYKKLKSLLDVGIQPDIDIIDSNLTNEQAIALEIELIRIHGRLDNGTGCLTNHTDGGEGGIGNLNSLGRIQSDYTKNLISKANIGHSNGIGIECSIEKRIKISKTLCKLSKEIKDKLKLNLRLIKGHPICSYNLKTNEIIKIYLSIKQAKENGYWFNQIKEVLNKLKSDYRGVGWRYLTEEEISKYLNKDRTVI